MERATSQPTADATESLGDVPLAVHQVSKTWKKPPLEVLRGIELELGRGEVALVEGRNGVGKTTLLRILAGLIGPDDGYVRAFGLHPERDRKAYQTRVKFLSAGNLGLYARLTARQQIDLWARVSFVPRDRRDELVDQAVVDFDLTELAARRSDRLSLGQRQRLRLAMTFVSLPDLVLLDEPRSSLDGEGGELLTAAIQRVAERRGAVLWVAPTGEQFDFDFSQRYLLEAGGLREVA